MQPETRPLGLRGFLIDSPAPGRLRGIRDGALVVEDGRIGACGSYETVRAAQPGRDIRWMHSPETVLIPGLIDLHGHLPQFPAVARHAEDAGSWLQRQIVPLEKQFRTAAARTQAPAYFAELAKHGTTCAMLAAAVFEDSTEMAFSAAEQSGLRITMGKIMMDAGPSGGHAPEKSADQSCAESESLCRKWNGRGEGRIHYAFSPRSVHCSENLLRKAAGLAEKHGAALQMPLGETAAENG
ncbi:MAG TPA: amidohydrolase family protein, partial [Terrimicrobiaceae bacterium]|nr:amidohydrolase family protein [Terrimicrobiaceae bacterium]